ncbi:ubiquinone biosynthesis monooxygenase Coq7 [Thiothrix eikelboomii]|uniref:3-demethoxyubiquinol 3-hydroxylase n=2 Tax=Thiothrix eikelboomii TaxID=92487 RepID=A0A1T4VXX6_9GAMM|nr:ubiquinone biosynthesis monooxygenase Coq7 [Thiothrix eikelboomii]
MMRTLSLFDRFLVEIDQSLRATEATPTTTERPHPAQGLHERAELTAEEKKRSAQLMRINHAGEVAAQGLYRGQALTAKLPQVREQMERAALEENDHLVWCAQRLDELSSHRSHLNPIWYWGSFSMGAAAGLIGDQWSLGFVKETEDQVERHLAEHLAQLPANDLPSTVILQQMKEDELRHGQMAQQAGGVKLPFPLRKLVMPMLSTVMTRTAKYL